MIDRVFKNWKTSTAGVFLLGSSIATVLLDKATLPEAGTFIVLSFGLFFSKDKINKK